MGSMKLLECNGLRNNKWSFAVIYCLRGYISLRDSKMHQVHSLGYAKLNHPLKLGTECREETILSLRFGIGRSLRLYMAPCHFGRGEFSLKMERTKDQPKIVIILQEMIWSALSSHTYDDACKWSNRNAESYIPVFCFSHFSAPHCPSCIYHFYKYVLFFIFWRKKKWFPFGLKSHIYPVLNLKVGY